MSEYMCRVLQKYRGERSAVPVAGRLATSKHEAAHWCWRGTTAPGQRAEGGGRHPVAGRRQRRHYRKGPGRYRCGFRYVWVVPKDINDVGGAVATACASQATGEGKVTGLSQSVGRVDGPGESGACGSKSKQDFGCAVLYLQGWLGAGLSLNRAWSRARAAPFEC